MGYDEMDAYRDLIKENIEYDILTVKLKPDIAMLDEIVDLLTETVCTNKGQLGNCRGRLSGGGCKIKTAEAGRRSISSM